VIGGETLASLQECPALLAFSLLRHAAPAVGPAAELAGEGVEFGFGARDFGVRWHRENEFVGFKRLTRFENGLGS
jgi:hypothetical protein